MEHKKMSKMIYVIAFFSGLGGFLFGYDTGAISGALLFIRDDFALTTAQQELVVSILLIGAAIGAVIAGVLSDKYGRRKVVIVSSILFMIGVVFMAEASNWIYLLVGRLIVGLAIGLASMVIPLYVSELAPAHIRGTCVAIFQLMITIGILGAYFVDYAFAADKGWRWMLGIGGVPAVILFIAMLFLPETPRWLARQGYWDKARNVFRRLKCKEEEIETSLKEIASHLEQQQEGFRYLFRGKWRSVVIIGMLLMVFQQVTGINTVIYYAPIIFEKANVPSDSVKILATIGVGVVNVLMTIVAIKLIDRWGRKPLLYTGIIGMIVGLIVLGTVLQFYDDSSMSGLLALISLVIYIASFAIGLGPIAWLINSEIYPLKVRGVAVSCATLINWAANFVVAMTFLTLLDTLGDALTFWLYAALSVVCIFFVHYKIPETKDKTLEEIESMW